MSEAPRGRAPRGRRSDATLHGRRFTGHSVADVYASNTGELTSCEHPNVPTDGAMTSGQSSYTDIFKGVEKRRRNRWSACVWFALISSCVALLLSGISLHQAFMIRKRVLTDLNTGSANAQNLSLQRNVSELLEKYNKVKIETSAILLNISKTVQTYFDDIRKKMDESDVRFKKTNISIWDKFATLRGPRGYNGTQGNTGPQRPPGIQGLQGPWGLTIEGCWYKSISSYGARFERSILVRTTNSTTKVYYGMTCKTSLADQKLAVGRADSNGYLCTCQNSIPRISFTCTINCIYCTFL